MEIRDRRLGCVLARRIHKGCVTRTYYKPSSICTSLYFFAVSSSRRLNRKSPLAHPFGFPRSLLCRAKLRSTGVKIFYVPVMRSNAPYARFVLRYFARHDSVTYYWSTGVLKESYEFCIGLTGQGVIRLKVVDSVSQL